MRTMLTPTRVRGTMSVLRPEWRHLSPAIGLVLGPAFVNNVFEAGAAEIGTLSPAVLKQKRAVVGCGPAMRTLAVELFHRNHDEETLYPTRNQSLPAAHLSASLTAHVAAIARAGLSGTNAHDALKGALCSATGLPLNKLARAVGVSIARFERLVELVRVADNEDGREGEPMAFPRAGSALLMHHLWLTSSPSGRWPLWRYLKTLDEYYGPALIDPAESEDVWLEKCFSQDDLGPIPVRHAFEVLHLLGAGGSGRTISSSPFESAQGGADGSRSSNLPGSSTLPGAEASMAFELLAASLLGGAKHAPLLQGKYSHQGQPEMADCAELACRELLNALLWCPVAQRFDLGRLPTTASTKLSKFYHAFDYESLTATRNVPSQLRSETAHTASSAWFTLVSGLPGVRYLKVRDSRDYSKDCKVSCNTDCGVDCNRSNAMDYEMLPSVGNVMAVLGRLLFARPSCTVEDFEVAWNLVNPGCPIEIQEDVTGERLKLFWLKLLPKSRSADGAAVQERPRALALELIVSERINHAFAIHHVLVPPWLRAQAESALEQWVRRPSSTCGVLHDALVPALAQQAPDAARLLGASTCAEFQRQILFACVRQSPSIWKSLRDHPMVRGIPISPYAMHVQSW